MTARRAAAVAITVVVAGLTACGADDDPSSAEAPLPLRPEATGEPGRPTPADGSTPQPCIFAELEATRPSVPADAPGAPGPAGDVPAVVATPEQRDHAVAIVLDHPGWEAALAAGRARLVWATPWSVEDEVERGVLLMFEMDEPVDLPTDVGIPSWFGDGEGAEPVYDDEGLPVLDPVPDGGWADARSAQLAVDLVDDRLSYVVAGPEPSLC